MFGEKCKVNDAPLPTNDTGKNRTIPGIFLGTTGSASGTCQFMSLETGKRIVRPQF